MDKLFWHIIPCGTTRARFSWGVEREGFFVPLVKTGTKELDNIHYWCYDGELLNQPCQFTYIFGQEGLIRVRIEFVFSSQRHQVVALVFNSLCDICGTPGSSGMEPGQYYEQGLVSWEVEDTSMVLAVSSQKVVLNVFAKVDNQPQQLNEELATLIDDMALSLVKN